MANYTGSNSLDDVMGAGTESAGTAGVDRWSSGAGNDTFNYEPSTAGGADRYFGGLGKDTVEFRLTAAEWANTTTQANLIAFKAAVDAKVASYTSCVLGSGNGFTPLSFGINKSLTVYEAENVRVYADNQLVLGTAPPAPPTTVGAVTEAGVDSAYAAQPGTPQATGLMPGADVDGNAISSGATWSIAGLPAETYGAFSITPAGQWTYLLDNQNPATQGLQTGQVVVQVFLLAATFGMSAAFSAVTITVEGSNDKALIQLDGGDFAVSERGGLSNGLIGPDGDGASGQLTLTNLDGAPPPTLPANQPFAPTVTVAGAYGDLVVTRGATVGTQTTAIWAYTLRNGEANVQALAGGQVVFDAITLPASAFDGASSTITIRVTGGDDHAMIGMGAFDVTVTEADGIQNGTPGDALAGGTFTQTDPDNIGPLTFAPLTQTPLDALGHRADNGSSVGRYGDFALNPITGAWTYTLDNNRPATQALQEANASAEVPAALETLTVASGTSPGATQTITVNIFGGDDLTQSITNSYDPNAGSSIEAKTGADATAGGQLTRNDADGTHAAFSWTAASPSGGPLTIVGGGGKIPNAQSYAGQYGDFTLNGATGSWTYTRNDSGLPYLDSDALGGGQSATDVMFVKSNDDGASAAISVTIIGKDDAAVMTGTATDDVIEAGGQRVNTINLDPIAQGKVQSVDKDAGQSGWTAASAGTLVGSYGNFEFNFNTGDWSYTLRNADANVEALIASQQATDTLLLTSKDGTSHVITVTIHGSNDSAVISFNGVQDRSVKEAGGWSDGVPGDPLASGDLDMSDVDGVGALTEARFRAVPLVNGDQGLNGLNDLTGIYGMFSFNPNTGAWSYVLSNNAPATQALHEGQIVTDTMVVYSKDVSASHAITVTVEGAYDQVDLSNTYTPDEASGGHQVRAEGTWRNASGAATAVVADYNAAGALTGSPTGFYVVPVALALRGVYGTFTVTAAGAWTYRLDNEDPDTLALLSALDSAGQHMRSAQEFLTVATTTDAVHPAPETYTIGVDVFGAYTVVDYQGLAADATTPNTGGAAAPGALPAIHGNGTITFTVRNGDGGETLRLYAGDPLAAPFPWGTVNVNDGAQTTVSMPTGPASSAPGVINQVLHVWDGDTGMPANPALNLGLSIAQGTVDSDLIVMVGNGGLAAGYTGNDRITGTATADYMDGGEHDDLLQGAQGNDTLLGGNGNDELLGQDGNDRLEGGAGQDTLNGGDGDDVLVPGAGRDRLTGGAGSDTFAFGIGPFGSPTEDDAVTDYSVADDSLWFEQSLLLNTGYNSAALAGNDWFNTATAAQITTQTYEANDRFIYDPTQGLLYYDVDGGTASGPVAPLLVALFAGSPALVATEFVFGPLPGP